MRASLGCIFLISMMIDSVNAELIVNGGFEQPGITQGTTKKFDVASNPQIPGWTITQGSVDIVKETFYPAAEGSYSLDLVGLGFPLGEIEQTFSTVIGNSYDLSFQYSNNALAGTGIDFEARVQAIGSSQLVDAKVTHRDASVSDMNYQMFFQTFVADSTSTTLRFTALNGGTQNGGIALDDVSVSNSSVVPEPASIVLFGFGSLIVWAWFKRVRITPSPVRL